MVSNSASYLDKFANNLQNMVSNVLSIPEPAPRAQPVVAQYRNAYGQMSTSS